MEVVPKIATSSIAATVESASFCNCANGGRCVVYPEGFSSCECESGFEGMRCERLIFEHSHGKNRNLEENNSIPATIAIVSIASLIALVGVYLMWRKYKNVLENHEKKQCIGWPENRRKSTTAMETPKAYDTPVSAHSSAPDSALNLSRKAHHTNLSYCVSMENLEIPSALNDSTESKNNHAASKQRHLPTIQAI